MIRNWTVIREVLEDVEQGRLDEKLERLADDLERAKSVSDDAETSAEKEQNRYFEHLLLSIEGGLVEGVDVKTMPAPPPWRFGTTYPRLTMQGHDMLDALRSKTVWARVVNKASEMSLPITLELIKAVMTSIIKGI